MTVVVISAVILAAELLALRRMAIALAKGSRSARPRRTTFVAPISAAAARALASISYVMSSSILLPGARVVLSAWSRLTTVFAQRPGGVAGSGLPKN